MPHNRLTSTDAILPAAAGLAAMSMGLPPTAAEMRFAHKAPELCSLCSDWQPSTARTLWLAEPKVDGIRALWIGGDVGVLMTREGNLLGAGGFACSSLLALEADFGKPMFFDGELAHPDGFEATLASFRRGVPDPALTLWLFDAVPLDVWAAAGRTAPLDARRGALASLMLAKAGRPSVGMLKPTMVSGADAADCAAEAIARGLEGIVLKDATAPYVRGRGADWRRIKAVATLDAQVIAVSRGGRTLHCALAGVNLRKPFDINLPSDNLAKIGDVIEIAHNGFHPSGIPRHARFVRVTAKRTIA
jgi:ATP-dependent DNA ligase